MIGLLASNHVALFINVGKIIEIGDLKRDLHFI